MKLPRDLSGRNLARALEVLGYSITRRLLFFFIRIGVGALTGAVVGLAIAVFVAGVYALPKAADLTARLGPLGEVATAGLAGATLTGLVAGCLGTLARGPASAAVIGLVSMLPLYGSALLVLRGPPSNWSGFDVAVVLALSALTGGSGGARLWMELEREKHA
ncbi:MAG: hypothetical protein IT352_09140 [Gemmatimonadales bacterium]|nr:hypothetical protein [Gemmatimonadales bacterium]